jgi:hypothetical protein
MITDELEIRQLMREARQGLIDANELTNTQKAKMLHFANQDLQRAVMEEINGLLIANPHTNFEYWTERLSTYKDAKTIIDWLALQPKADTRYFLNNEQIKAIQKHQDYAGYKDQIEAHGSMGFIIGNDTLNVYTPTLCYILSRHELQVYNLDAQKDETINGMGYLDTYKEAYYKGIQHFEDEIKVNPNVLYGANAESIVKDLHHKYFHAKNSASSDGWQFVKKSFPFILTHKAISEYGYFSGIVSKVDEMIIKYPNVFKTFDKCEIKEQEKGIETIPEAKPLTNKQKALIAVYCNEIVTRATHGNDTYNHWLKYNNPKDRIADPESKRKYKARVKLFEEVINLLSEPYKQKALDDLNTYKSRYEKENI